MSKRSKPGTPLSDPVIELEPREEAILRAIIRQHVASGEPIGSKAVAGGPSLELSAATIRNVMSDLEERGLLIQPHASAGRLPTAKAYRIYVDRLIRRQRISPSQTRSIEEAIFGRRGEIADLLNEASRQLSRMSHQIGIVLGPEISRIVVEHLEFVRLDHRRIVAIVVGRSGVVHNRILESPEAPPQSELDQVGRYLTEELGGRTLPEIRRILRERLSEERAEVDRMVQAGLELGRQAIEAEADATELLIVDGASNLLDAPEFSEPKRMKSLMQALERKRALVDLLGRVLDEPGVHVVLGEEHQSPDLADCALVASSYGPEGRVVGTLGVVGPQRMEYAQAIALVDHVAQVVSRYLAAEDLTKPPEEPKFLK